MHIVLVEDDEVIRETTQISLERFGYTVSAFEDGRDGYEFVAAHGADVVLLDLMLPTMNGASICRAIRERSSGSERRESSGSTLSGSCASLSSQTPVSS